VIVVDHVAAGFGMLAIDERFADGVHASADAVTGIHDRDICAGGDQITRRRQTGEARTGDKDGRSVQRSKRL
jgi:hypothetical protein